MKWDERREEKKQREKMYFSIIYRIVYMVGRSFKLFVKANDMFAIKKKRITSTNYTIFQLNLHCIWNELVFISFWEVKERERNRARDWRKKERDKDRKSMAIIEVFPILCTD